jgi:dTDP-4-dehydrorhamnose 3,5-epimerase
MLGGVQVRELSIPDAYEITPTQVRDDRGVFLEWYRHDRLEETIGHSLDLRQANTSVSAAGVVRGVHFADVPPGQAKYVTLTAGSAIDFVVDIRVGSPTYGAWDSVLLDTTDRRAVYISEGLGHCFLALEPDTVVNYLVSATYTPGAEHGISPLDPDIALVFPLEASKLLLSPKDLDAPSLAEARELGVLPTWDETRAYYEFLNKSGR